MWMLINDLADIRPGDGITIVSRRTRRTWTSTVKADGTYIGCLAVAGGRADVAIVSREYAAPAGTLEAEFVEQLRHVRAELDALRDVVFDAANELRGLPSDYTEAVDARTQRVVNADRLYQLYRDRSGEIGSDLRKALPEGYRRHRRG
ncbi:hypothetical protein [Nocardia sp. NRRL S-836]|uniref:hypothetical protein n=1 Tax=Nocardia sp. NRRL S-836 TaxID=1519492 RepID=UPI0006B006F7|nr:hypothetical protein [Nocardia sp. NRRL S-836]KOV77452.1 hypothetical protein ADL03_41740 [Nocardia sp. NRRL S-836]